MMDFQGDSTDYHIIDEGVEIAINNKAKGMFCELGLRRGKGTQHIINTISRLNIPNKTIITIDPYGELPYQVTENDTVICDYNNQMRNETLSDMYTYAQNKGVNFLFFCMTDDEFFKRFSDYVPVYDSLRTEKLDTYAFVHLDGPHSYDYLSKQIDFFAPRQPSGSVLALDDVQFYDFIKVDNYAKKYGYYTLKKTDHKIIYMKE